MKILVVGASGMLGEPVARRLRDDGHDVRLLARDPAALAQRFGDGFEVVQGDVTRPETLPAALAGCEGVHINLRGRNTVESYRQIELAGVENLCRAAPAAGIRRIAYVSGAGDEQESRHTVLGDIKAGAVAAIKASGVPYTVWKPTHFMESLPQFIQRGRATVIGRQPHRYHYLAAADFARMVSRGFSTDGAANQSLTILGPEAYTMREALEIYCARCHPGMSVGSMPIWLARTIGKLSGNQNLVFASMLFAGFKRFGERGDPTLANTLLGAPSITLRQWCAARAQARGISRGD